MSTTTSPQFSGPPLIAGASIPPNVLLMLSTTANNAIKATANANTIGCSGSGTRIAEGLPGYDAAIKFAANDPVGADFNGSVSLVTAGAAVVLTTPYFGYVEANSSGYAVNSSSPGNHNFAGVALEPAAAQGELIRVWLNPKSVTI